MDYRSVANDIYKCIGGRENIVSAAHCATRLRLVIADNAKCSKKELELWREYKYIIVNDDLNTASEALSGLIKSFRLSSARLKEPPFDEY